MASTRRMANVKSRVGARANVAVARPKGANVNMAGAMAKRPKLRSRTTWFVGAEKMAAISVSTARVGTTKHLRLAPGSTKKVPVSFIPTVRSSTSWVIALVQRTGPGPTDFRVLKRSVARYPKPNPGELILQILAKEFGLKGSPKKLTRMNAGEIGSMADGLKSLPQ